MDKEYDLESICECQYNETGLIVVAGGVATALVCLKCEKRVGSDIKKQDMLLTIEEKKSTVSEFELNKQKVLLINGLFYQLANFEAFSIKVNEEEEKIIAHQKIIVKNGKATLL